MPPCLQDLWRLYGFALVLQIAVLIVAALQLLPSRMHHETATELAHQVLATLIAAVPIGGPTVVICTNAACSYKLKKKGISVLDPAKLKTAAAVSIVCFDKTGTLTGSVVSNHSLHTALLTPVICSCMRHEASLISEVSL